MQSMQIIQQQQQQNKKKNTLTSFKKPVKS